MAELQVRLIADNGYLLVYVDRMQGKVMQQLNSDGVWEESEKTRMAGRMDVMGDLQGNTYLRVAKEE